jgi:3-dehydroquinate synthase
VAEDEFDNGRRALLNFGHSFGHAIEKKYSFSKYNHGEAVAIGMHMAANLGERLGVTEVGTAARISALLERAGLTADEARDGLLDNMRSDKKGGISGLNLILLRKIGEAISFPIEYDRLGELLDE